MRRILLWTCMMSVGIVSSWSMVCADDFYVIPTVRKSFAPVAKTGQTKCYDVFGDEESCATTGSGQDGALQKGVPRPSPRFTINSNGTVTDNQTGLIWLRNADCLGVVTWSEALQAASLLQHGTCGLSDGSRPGDWRLPNRFELESLIDLAFYNITLSNAAGTAEWTEGDAFSAVQTNVGYWSSTTYLINPEFAWTASFADGHVFIGNKITAADHFWAVRGGQ